MYNLTKAQLNEISIKLFNSKLIGLKDDYITQLNSNLALYGNELYNDKLIEIILDNSYKEVNDIYLDDYIYMIKKYKISTYDKFLYKYLLGYKALYNSYKDDIIKVSVDYGYIFNDQFNGNDNKRYLEYEYIIFNSKGYNALELKRKNTLICGYCGKLYDISTDLKYCDKCRNSEYLTEENYYLLELKPINNNMRVKHTIPINIKKDIIKLQKARAIEDGKRDLINIRKQLENDIKIYKKNILILKYLLNNDKYYQLLDNFIYYNHNNILSFNWKKEDKPASFYNSIDKEKFESDLNVTVKVN